MSFSSSAAPATQNIKLPLDPRLYNSSYYSSTVVPPSIVQITAKEDEVFVNNWLIKIGKNNLIHQSAINDVKKPLPTSKSHLTIHAAKENLKKCLEITKKLEESQQILKENVSTMTTEDWKSHTSIIGVLKDDLTLLMAQFQHPSVVTTLKHELAKRAKKRASQKLKRLENKLQNARKRQETLETHQKIDSWLAARKEEAERTKAEEKMKKDADCVLAEVTRKKTEAKKQLALVTAIIKLRNVRETTARACGTDVPAKDNLAFCKTTETLIKAWENSLRTNGIEEQGLKLMLERNASEDCRQTRAVKEKEIMQQWDEVLLGPAYVPSPLYWALTAAQHDMEKFIAIRKSWDTFLTTAVENSSKIPIGWVIPESNPSLEWSLYKQ